MSFRRFSRGLFLFSFSCLGSDGFPPTPDYTLFGLVKDQVGQVLPSGEGEVVVLQGAKEIMRRPIKTRGVDENYRLPIKMNQQLFGTANFDSSAIKSGSFFEVVVDLNGSRFYPIEATSLLQSGSGGEFVRLDLNLGEDSDGDGLPDIWEQWQLYNANIFPDSNGWRLDLISKEGDFDKDGQNDGSEYLTGTYATDASEIFYLEILRGESGAAQFEFYQVTGKSYTLEATTDFIDWEAVDFSVEEGNEVRVYEAPTSKVVEATTLTSEQAQFFRLTVR